MLTFTTAAISYLNKIVLILIRAGYNTLYILINNYTIFIEIKVLLGYIPN